MINFRNNPNQDSPYNEYGSKCEHGEVGRCVDCEDEKLEEEAMKATEHLESLRKTA
jgi:hypothetical protein